MNRWGGRMNDLSSILNWIGNTIGNSALGTTATTLKGAIAELADRTSKKTANPQQYTDGIDVEWSETMLTKYDNIVECKLRFRVVSSAALPASKKLFEIPTGFRPSHTIRPIVHDWNLGSVHRFNLFGDGSFQTIDTLPTGLIFIMTFFYTV